MMGVSLAVAAIKVLVASEVPSADHFWAHLQGYDGLGKK
jgi:hypothetical protein